MIWDDAGYAMYEIAKFLKDVDYTVFLTDSNAVKHTYTQTELNRISDIQAERKLLNDRLVNETDPNAILQIMRELNALGQELHKIETTFPGALPQALNSVSSAVNRFNTVEQPKLESILDDLDGSVKQFTPKITGILADTDDAIKQATPQVTGILKGTGEMLATTRTVPRDFSELNGLEQQYVQDLWDKNTELMGERLERKDELDKLKASGKQDKRTLDRINELISELDVLKHEYDANEKEVERVLISQPGVIPDTIYSLDNFFKQVTPQVTNTIGDVDSMLTIRRTAPRDESELNEAEQLYLSDLQKREQDLQEQIKAKSDEIARLKASGASDQQTKDAIDVLEWQLGNIQKAEQDNYREIIRILYTQPGVIPEAVYDIGQTVKRFNAVEQPKIEDILDSVDDAVEETAGIMARMHELFVVKTLVPVPDNTLSPQDKGRLQGLLDELQAVELNVQKQQSILKHIQTGSIIGTSSRPSSKISVTVDPVAKGNGSNKTLSSGISAIGLGTVATGIQKADMLRDNQKAYLKQVEREKLKVEQQIGRIRFKEVDTPGVIPKILSGVQDTVERLNKEDQPRLEKILDNVNGNLDESKGILGKVNDTLGKITGLANHYSLLIKVGLAVSGCAIVLTLVLIPILLIRMILFGL